MANRAVGAMPNEETRCRLQAAAGLITAAAAGRFDVALACVAAQRLLDRAIDAEIGALDLAIGQDEP